mgnify:CR=1 FL=1
MNFSAMDLIWLSLAVMVFMVIVKAVLRKIGVNVKDVENDETIITNDITSPFSDDMNNIGK